MSAEVEFGELPPDGRGSTGADWTAIAATLRENPRAWAKVLTRDSAIGAGNTAGNIRRGRYAALKPSEFEVASRGRDLWARYVGDPS